MTLQQATLPTPRFDQIELENLKQDNRLINFLNQIIYERQIYLDLLERGFMVPTNNLIKEIDAEISRIE